VFSAGKVSKWIEFVEWDPTAKLKGPVEMQPWSESGKEKAISRWRKCGSV